MDISSLFGSGNAFSDVLRARSRLQTQPVDANVTAESIKKSINRSTYLEKSGKQTLNRLTDTVSQFAEGNSRLLRDIQGISNLMQLGAKEEISDNSSAVTQLLKAHYARGGIVDLSA